MKNLYEYLFILVLILLVAAAVIPAITNADLASVLSQLVAALA